MKELNKEFKRGIRKGIRIGRIEFAEELLDCFNDFDLTPDEAWNLVHKKIKEELKQ